MGCGEAMKVVATALVCSMMMMVGSVAAQQNYSDALSKSILFFEGQRSGWLPSSQRIKWRSHSAVHDGSDRGVNLVGGYYDGGDNVKFNFPMAFTTTMLAWSVIDFGEYMGNELNHTLEAIKWATDYLLLCSNGGDTIFVGVGDPWKDHECWERPEDMDTPRTSASIDKDHPGSEVSAEMAAAFAAASMAFSHHDNTYASRLLNRATLLFDFAVKHQGSYNNSIGHLVCPYYCDYNGYQDELVWAAAWIYKATKQEFYGNYVKENIEKLAAPVVRNFGGKAVSNGGTFTEFGWDAKQAGIVVLFSELVMNNPEESYPFVPFADGFICSVLPESPTKSVSYSPGGLMFKPGGANMQHVSAIGFIVLAYARSLQANNKVVNCGGNFIATPSRLISLVKSQADYILGKNPLGMSYMVGYGNKYPQQINHRGSVMPSIFDHPKPFGCRGGDTYFNSTKPNINILTGAVVGGPFENDFFVDTRSDPEHLEPTTYINAPLVGIFAYFKAFTRTWVVLY